jgi:MFS family permease
MWMAATVSYVGSFIQDVAERWLILDLTHSALAAAMLATTMVGASFVAMLPAGVLADRLDRRTLVVWSQLAQGAVALALSFATWTGHVTPTVLLIGAGAAGLGLALGGPAWTALVSDILPPDQVAEGVTLNAIAFNLARAVGPAIGGLVMSALGPAFSFFANAITFIGVVVAVVAHRRAQLPTPSSPPPSVGRAFVEPFGHVLRERGLVATIGAMLAFSVGAAFVYALTPAFAKLTLASDPRAYGLMLGAMGTGAVIGAAAMKPLRRRLPPRLLVGTTMILYGASSLVLARVHTVPLAVAAFVPVGIGWTGSFSSLSALVQVWVPSRMRARVMALYTMAHFAAWGIAAATAGAIAERWGIRVAFLVGGVTALLSGLVTTRLPIPRSFTTTS